MQKLLQNLLQSINIEYNYYYYYQSSYKKILPQSVVQNGITVSTKTLVKYVKIIQKKYANICTLYIIRVYEAQKPDKWTSRALTKLNECTYIIEKITIKIKYFILFIYILFAYKI